MNLEQLVVCCLAVACLAARPVVGRELPHGARIDAPNIQHHHAHQAVGHPRPFPKSCRDLAVPVSGVHRIQPEWPFRDPLLVYCDQGFDGGGWTVVQRRVDGTVNFERPIRDYVHGFGNIDAEFWLGLDNIYRVVNSAPHELVVVLDDVSGNTTYARYGRFRIEKYDAITPQYATKSFGSYTGTAGDFWNKVGVNAFAYRVGGFWREGKGNLNGDYGRLSWGPGQEGSIKATKIMVRPVPKKE